ncbi:MAG: 6-bladed beta-propeller [Salinivirgaceae bacterium]|nr:6-bladed beta-propeller [Salinivirgaceae bacterium]
MKTNLLSIAAICATMMACNSKTENAVTDHIELTGSVDNEAFVANIESIDVLNLQMDDDWVFEDGMQFALSDNYLYMVCGEKLRLTSLKLQSGEKLTGRMLRGNGPGEINGLSALFCVGDTLFVLDGMGIVRQYDNNGHFLGKIHDFGDTVPIRDMFRLKNGDFVLIRHSYQTSDSVLNQVLIADQSFNIKAEHFALPLPRLVIVMMGGGKPYCASGDAIRFFFYSNMDNHLYSLCGDSEQCTELGLPNPQTAEIFIDASNEIMRTHTTDAFNKLFELDGSFGNLCESGRFICFRYYISHKTYIAMIDKRSNSVVSLYSDGDDEGNVPNYLYRIFSTMEVLYSDGEYIYAKCKSSCAAKLFDGNDDLLDARLKKSQAQFRAYLDRNAEYIKGLDEDEREATNVILKIKLKD